MSRILLSAMHSGAGKTVATTETVFPVTSGRVAVVEAVVLPPAEQPANKLKSSSAQSAGISDLCFIGCFVSFPRYFSRWQASQTP